MQGKVLVDNETGHTLKWAACDAFFAVSLQSKAVRPGAIFRLCLRSFTVARGVSTYPVIVRGDVPELRRTGAARRADVLAWAEIAGAPNGHVQAVLFQAGRFVPRPPPIQVVVTGSAPRTELRFGTRHTTPDRRILCGARDGFRTK